MLTVAVIVFREVLEAALLVGIVAAATRDVPGRGRWLWGGIGLGAVGAAVVAVLADAISELASGVGQELFNAGVLLAAVLMLGWHNAWMSVHGRELASRARRMGTAIVDGRAECSVLLAVIAIAILREGSETVLFVYGVVAAEGTPALSLLAAGIAGVGLGALVGYGLYAGLLRIPVKHFFTVTTALILLLAAGMASQAARFLIQADLIPSLAAPLWDTSAFLPEDSIFGNLLHALAGYDARPAGMQVVFYGFAVAATVAAMRWTAHRTQNQLPTEKPL